MPAQIEYDGEIKDAEFEDREKIARDNEAVEDQIQSEFLADPEAVKWKINVLKIDEKTKDHEHCFYCTPEDFPIADRLREEYGHGVFKALIYKNGRLHRNLLYRIAKRLENAPAVAPRSEISEIGQILKTQTEQLSALMSGRTPLAAPPDPMQQVTATVTLLAKMKDFFSPGQSKSELEVFLKAFELAKDYGGGAASEKSVYDLLSDVVKSDVGKELAESFRSARSQAQRRQMITHTPPSAIAPPLPQATATPANADAPETGDDGGEAQLAVVRERLTYLVGRARANTDPGLYADLIVDNYGVENVREMLADPNLRAKAIIAVPEVAEFWPWFQELIDELHKILTDTANEAQNLDEPPAAPDGSSGESETSKAATVSVERSPRNGPALSVDAHPKRGSGGKGDAGNHAHADKAGKGKPRNPATGRKSDKPAKV